LLDLQRLNAAFKASGKSQIQVAREAGATKDWVSRLLRGVEKNPTSDLVVGVAAALGTQVGYLYGETLQLSPADQSELGRFRDWIDDKLATIDARKQPNATLLTEDRKIERVADRRSARSIPEEFKRPGKQHILLAHGDSMSPAGIVANDMLYTALSTDTLGKIIACRVTGSVFVKRLVTEHRRLFLLSADPRYMPIRIDEKTDEFEILGVVIGRTGAID
jgi:transcriptional regulator with XRE-family HTH domain